MTEAIEKIILGVLDKEEGGDLYLTHHHDAGGIRKIAAAVVAALPPSGDFARGVEAAALKKIKDAAANALGAGTHDRFSLITWIVETAEAALSPASVGMGEPSAKEALQVIADLPVGKTEDVLEGQEQAYRAVEKLFASPPAIQATPAQDTLQVQTGD